MRTDTRRTWWALLRWLTPCGLLYASGCSGVDDIVNGALQLAFGIVEVAT